MSKENNPSHGFYYAITGRPKLWLTIGITLIALFASFIPTLTIDPSAESFLPKDHSARIYRDKVEEIFGINDPMVIAVKVNDENGVFTPDTLTLVQWLTDEIKRMPNIDSQGVMSLATEDNIIGTEEGMEVEPFIDQAITNQALANKVKMSVMDFPLYVGSLVSRDTSTTLIVTEMIDDTLSPQVYEDLLALVERAPIRHNEQLHVAGDGAVSGYLVTYINADMARLVPMSVIIITILCMLSFKTLQGVQLPGLVILAATISAIGSMAAMGEPIYVITTSMPILLVGVAVADSLHILSEYYEEMAANPDASQRTLVIESMGKMWRPVLLTTVTSMIGFLGVYFSSYMPPMQTFGLYSMVGLAMAGVYSLVILPATQMLFKPIPSRAFKNTNGHIKADIFATIMTFLGSKVLAHSKLVLVAGIVISISGVVAAFHLEVNEAWVDNFQKTDAIYIADQQINLSMDGTNSLDIVIETTHTEDLFKPENLKKIEALQRYIETLPNVGGTTSIVDYIKQMNRALMGGKDKDYIIPDDESLISQYFLLYSTSGDPTDFEQEIDYDYRLALVKTQLSTGKFQDTKKVVEPIQHYIAQHFNNSNIKAFLSGRVNVDYEWLVNLLDGHYKGILFAFVLVLIVTCLSFKSVYGGLLAGVPVILTTLSVYAFMGLTGITLSVGTTMASAIAMGIGIDFSIHTIERYKHLIKDKMISPADALPMLYPSTGRALLFNFFAVFLGFGLLGLSHVPPLSNLGLIIAFAVLVSFVSSMTVLPALIKHLKPAFLGFRPVQNDTPISTPITNN